jgi:6-phosphofructokinase 1
MASRIRRVGILTSGGDSPGYNPCIRAVVRTCLSVGWEPWGIRRGFAGLLNSEATLLNSRSVSGIIGAGGTMLGSSRSETFNTPAGLRDAIRNLNEDSLDALVIIGGDGTLRGAHTLQQAGVRVIGIPGTIENDVWGTDICLGVDTALNTALDALDRIRDTASSQEQVFLVEMMGHQCGYLALMAGIAGGAEMVCIPEVPFTLEEVGQEVAGAYLRGKKHCIVNVAEGAMPNATEIAAYLRDHQEETGFAVRMSVLGHIQRGGSPTAYDRFLGTRLGVAAVRALQEGVSGVMVGMEDGQLVYPELATVATSTHTLDESYFALAQVLSR